MEVVALEKILDDALWQIQSRRVELEKFRQDIEAVQSRSLSSAQKNTVRTSTLNHLDVLRHQQDSLDQLLEADKRDLNRELKLQKKGVLNSAYKAAGWAGVGTIASLLLWPPLALLGVASAVYGARATFDSTRLPRDRELMKEIISAETELASLYQREIALAIELLQRLNY